MPPQNGRRGHERMHALLMHQMPDLQTHADAIARHHGSQCGFCTPGMVVACHAALSKHEDKNSSPSKEQMEKALDGNLCRCTGYRPILDACKVPELPNT